MSSWCMLSCNMLKLGGPKTYAAEMSSLHALIYIMQGWLWIWLARLAKTTEHTGTKKYNWILVGKDYD
jgi:hypothetical protein